MMKFLINLLVSAAAVFASAYILTGVSVDSFVTAILVALVLGLLNAFIRPVVMVLTLPINVLTLGLFSFVVNALLVLLVAMVVPGFVVDGILWAVIFGIVLAVVTAVLDAIVPGD
jgi:putative membrane protein